MAKSKPVKKLSSIKSKMAKSIVSAKKDSKKDVKKDIKKDSKKPIVQLKKAQPHKTHKVVNDSKKEKDHKDHSKDAKELKKTASPAVPSSIVKKPVVMSPAPKKPVEIKVPIKSTVEIKAPTKPHAVAKVVDEDLVIPASSKSVKNDIKPKSKIKKPEKKAEDDFDDDLIGDDFGESEIAEYEEDLKAVEEDDEDILLEISDDEDTEVKDEEIYLTDSEGRRLCRVRDCDQVSTVDGYCRYHYLLLWKKIQTRKHILIDGKLEKYVEELMARYPDKFLEVIKKDLKTEKDFLSVIQEMDLDESAMAENDNEDEVQSFADEIRGIGDAPSLDDDGDY